ncbi:MAG: AAA-like domain-containing protein [Anaerolineales bacterium]|nr:AAA-like domain-containing protein [Anaerolineales bacterium]
MKKNPFITGKRVPVAQFINRSKEIKDAVSLLLSGQSLAFTGYPRSGKTSLLLYLQELNLREILYGENANQMYFFYLDFQPISYKFTHYLFWQRVLTEYLKNIKMKSPKSLLLSLYKYCDKSFFSTESMETFLIQSQKEGWHLVLLLDEFDTILHNPELNNNEFLGGLRTLASRFGDALTLVISSQNTISTLNEETKKSTPGGSPYFNFLKEISILPFDRKHAQKIFSQSTRNFSKKEKEFLIDIAGSHAYLLQTAGSALWNAYENKYLPEVRLIIVGQEVLRTASDSLERVWQSWTSEMRKVFTVIALDEMPTLLGDKLFDIESMRKSILEYPRDIRYLSERGFIAEDNLLPSGYCVTAKVMLWWLAEELFIAIVKSDDLGKFLYKNQLDGLFTKGEQSQFISAMASLTALAKTSAATFVEAAAEGLGKGLTKT